MNKLTEQHEALALYIDALLRSDGAAPDAPAAAVATVDFLLIEVHGLTLALRAAEVAAVLPFSAVDVEWRDGRPVGWSADGGAAQPLVDLRRVVFPEGHGGHADVSPYRHLVRLHDGTALACDGIGETLCVAAADVDWRSARDHRPWLAGMLRGRRCAVIEYGTAERARH